MEKNNKDNNIGHFIATSDRETYDTLKALGYREISYDGTRWFFINDTKLKFINVDGEKTFTTNKINI